MISFAEFERLAAEANLVPIVHEISGDTETPVSAFLKLGGDSRRFMLESAHTGEAWGRYTYLGDKPLAHIKLNSADYEIDEGGAITRGELRDEQQLDPLRALLKRHKMARTPNLPRFAGGLVGYLGWGSVSWFEPRVPQRLGPDAHFPVGEWMLAGRLIVFDNLTHTLKLIACADLTKQDAKAAYASAKDEIGELLDALKKPTPEQPSLEIGAWKDMWDRDLYERAVLATKDYIAAGDAMQVVLSRELRAPYMGSEFEVYRALRRVSPTPYLFFLQFQDRFLAGASPEVMVRVENGRAILRPIAGTRRRGVDAKEDAALEVELKADPKELAEHVMLVDLGRNDIGRIAKGGTVRVEEREVIERYSHVMHLVSQVSGELREDMDVFDVIKATFPAGTVSGAPKVRAMEIIDELEPIARGPYAGAAGYIGWDGACDLAIAIRTISMAGGEIRLHAGGGIVHDSDPGKEFEETEHKLGAPRKALGAQP
jgi:anthranilate synthase component 1